MNGPDDWVETLGVELADAATPERADAMSAYMRDQFRFLGVRAPAVKQAARPVIEAMADATADELLQFANKTWQRDYREFQYAGVLVLRRYRRRLEPRQIGDAAALITDKSWWDTVDPLAAHVVGAMVAASPELVEVMDEWIYDPNIWLARTAILHQLTYRDATDADRLLRYALIRASDSEFFIRKAIGWSLRQYARVNPDAVAVFVADHRDTLSGLTVREALKHL